MTVLLVRRGSIETADGISTYILEIAQELLRRGVDCHILSGYLNRGGEDLEEYLKSTFGVEKVPEVTAVLGNGSMYKYLFTPIPWAKALAKLPREIEVIHANNFIPLPPSRHRRIATNHGSEGIVKVGGGLRIAYRLYVNMVASLYDKIIAVSDNLRNQLENIIPPPLRRKLVTLPPGIDISRYSPRRWEEREEAALHIGTSPRKNLCTTIHAMKIVWKTNPQMLLYITGPDSGYLRRCLSKLKESERRNTRHMGLLDKKSLATLLSKVKVLILPSRYETFSIASLESLASGTPVIASRAVPDTVVRHGVNGFKIRDPGDYRSLAYYIVKLVSNASLWGNMSSRGRKIAEKFNINKIVDKLLILYYNVQ